MRFRQVLNFDVTVQRLIEHRFIRRIVDGSLRLSKLRSRKQPCLDLVAHAIQLLASLDERWTTDDMNRVRAETASLMAANPMTRFKSVWSQLILQERRYSARRCTRLMPE